jgi:hypothetical protein
LFYYIIRVNITNSLNSELLWSLWSTKLTSAPKRQLQKNMPTTWLSLSQSIHMPAWFVRNSASASSIGTDYFLKNSSAKLINDLWIHYRMQPSTDFQSSETPSVTITPYTAEFLFTFRNFKSNSGAIPCYPYLNSSCNHTDQLIEMC